MTACYLLHDHRFDASRDALQFFDEARTQTAKVSSYVLVLNSLHNIYDGKFIGSDCT